MSKRLVQYTNLFPRLRKYKLILYIIASLLLLILTVSTYLYTIPLFTDDQQRCDMVWMWPSYARVTAFDETHSKHSSRYGLYLYREQGKDREPNENEDHEGFKTLLTGVPVLFIHGNAGSYEQVRSIAARCAEMFYEGNIQEKYPEARNIDFFTADFDEQLSAFWGMLDQVEYITDAIAFIASLYPESPSGTNNIILIGHSMGGLVAKIAAARNEGKVNTIVTLATPHADPFPWLLKTSEFNDEVGLVSIYSLTDLMVPPQVIQPKRKYDYYFTVDAARLLGVPMDHQSMVWCGQLREKVAEMLMGISGLVTLQDRMKVVREVFGGEEGPVPVYGVAYYKLKIMQSWVVVMGLVIFCLKWMFLVLVFIQLRKLYRRFK
ncbi:GPI inositol-deacylase [Candida viswanathii]|uniref:GPI inositol-deacylase n=1 Tax=Candida viswanathii TaxID=5486 RepID=A0A367XUU6_9ASCO|nr:GPI inositol-deacylase [Candida viswanathii]